ncbi:C6 transcription factor [Fusarium albosuccineum]|uniref:C6 transcription factor n=1 Tax=Fusarium albosuccineum TaxID=1237068 RepID=A0A8H4LPU8_9HYPO|nr:C6 transcription factor [Fusarium albosuccineum]
MSPNLSSSGSPPPKRRRRRPARSCEQCRRRKIRCNMGQPCNGCVRARAPMQCSYRDGSPGDTALGPSKNRELAPADARPEREEGEVAASQRTTAPRRDSVGVYPRGQMLHQPPNNGDNVPLQDQGSSLSNLVPSSQPLSSTSSSTCIPPLTPRLRHVPEKTKLFGQTHWLHTAEKFPISGKFHPVEVEPSFNDAKAELFETLKEARNLRFALKKQNSTTLDQPIRDLRETIPLKLTCDELIRCYLRTLEPLYRIIHVPSFWKEYERVWEDEHVSSPSTVFLIKLSLILAIGTTFKGSCDIEQGHLQHLAQTWIQNAQWWLTGPCEKTTYNLDGLQVFCLLLLARQTTFNCRGATSWLSSGSLLRAAMTMGLHRDPKLFPGLTLFEKEFRARLWTTVLELSVQCCLDLGLPLNLSEADYDACSPSNFNDSDLDSGLQQAPKPMKTPTDSTLQVLLAQSLPLRVEVIRLLNDFRHQQTYEKALAIGTKLRTACRDVAAFFHSIKNRDPSSNDGSSLGANEFHRKFMDIQLRRFIMFLHRDFMLQARIDPRFYLSRKVCVEAALVIASSSKDADLSLPTQRWDDMSRLSLVGRGLFKCALSFDAMLILALDVITQLQDESSPQHEADVLDEMARATRDPLIHVLESMREQLTHLVARGNTSLKRLLFANAHLTHIRALESGQPVKQAIYECVTQTLRDCVVVLREVQVGATPQDSVVTADSLNTDFFPLEFFSADNPMEWDISNLLGLPTLKDGQAQWPVSN